MLSWFPKLASKDGKRKGSKEDLKDTLQEQLNGVKHQEISSPRAPRLVRSRNLRWHLTELDRFEDAPRISLSSFSVASDNNVRSESLSSFLSEPVSPIYIDKHAPLPLPPLESSPENALNSPFLYARGIPQYLQPDILKDNGDGDGVSSEYSMGSSASSSPKSVVVEDVAAGWEGSGLGDDGASAFTSQARAKVTAPRQPQANGSDNTEAARPGSPLPVPHSSKVPFKTGEKQGFKKLGSSNDVISIQASSPNSILNSPLVSPRLSDAARPIPLRSKGLEQDGSRGWLQERMTYQDRSPYQSPRKSPLQSPRRSPLSSPKMASRAMSPQHLSASGTLHDYSPALHDDSQHAHPLPLPPALNAASVSPRSGVPSANRSEDPSRVDSPLASARWLWSPGRADVVPSTGKWLKGKLLGSGSFGKVYRGHHSETGDMCAIKEVEIVPDDPRSKESAKQLAQEIALLSTLRHPNILHYKGSEMVGDSLYIYLELVSGGSIYRLLQEFDRFAEPVIRRYTRQILLGLQYLHGKKTVHRDIKCANVLVDQDGKVKLADFGMAKLIGKDTAPLSFKGSPYWMAPEVIQQNNSGFELAVDIWSLGCTVIEMATGKPPWFQYEGYAAMFKVMNCHDTPIPDSLSPIGQDFVRLCLQRDPAKRPPATMLLEHPFMQLDNRSDSFVQSVSDTLSQGMMEKIGPKELDVVVHAPPWNAAGRMSEHGHSPAQSGPRSVYYCSSGPVSPRQTHQAKMPTSRSALQLSNYLRLPPQRQRPPLTEAEEHTNQYEGSPRNPTLPSHKRLIGRHELRVTVNPSHGWDSCAPQAYIPKK